MSLVPIPKVDVNANTDRSCNSWFCCFNWRCCNKDRKAQPVKEPSPYESESLDVAVTQTVQKTVEVVSHRRLSQSR